jgi:hypothetical protein
LLVYVTAHVAQAHANTLGGLFQPTWLHAVHIAFAPDSGYLALPCTAPVLLHVPFFCDVALWQPTVSDV